MFLADDLVLSAKKRGSIPTSQITFTEEDFLTIADAEMQGYLVPLVQGLREDYYVTEVDLPYAPSLRVPSRAVGGSLREVLFLDAQGNVQDPGRFSPSDPYIHGGNLRGFKLVGNSVVYVGYGTPPDTVRLSYYNRPNRLCRAESARRVTAINGAVLTLATLPVPVRPLSEGGPEWGTATSFDFIRSTPIYEHAAVDCAGTLSLDGLTLTLSAVNTDIEVGDYVAEAGYSPVVQAPVECHHLLAQRIAAKCLETLGFTGEMDSALAILTKMEKDAKVILTPRVIGAQTKVVPRNPLWRRPLWRQR